MASDFTAVAVEYAKAALADRKGKTHGKWVKRAAGRFLADLKRVKRKDAPFSFSREQANDACAFIEKLPHVEGVWETPEIVLDPA